MGRELFLGDQPGPRLKGAEPHRFPIVEFSSITTLFKEERPDQRGDKAYGEGLVLGGQPRFPSQGGVQGPQFC